MILKNPFLNAFGLDIGDLSIKLVQLFPHPPLHHQYRLKEIRTISLPPGLIVNGEIEQPELVRKKLLFLLGLEGGAFAPIKTPWVVASLPEPKTFLKLIDIEATGEELNAADIIYQAKKHLPFEIDETYIDWQLINTPYNATEKKRQVLIGAVTKITADSYIYLLESVGLTPVSLEIEAVAIARSMITSNKTYEKEARAILDLGATRSNLLIYDNQSVQFSTNVNFSGELITTALEQGLKITHRQAEELKIKNGVVFDPAVPKYLNIISKIVETLTEEMKNVFNFYYEHFNDTNQVNHITMCGGTSNWKNLDTFITDKLKVVAHPGHPWKNLCNPQLNKLSQSESLSLSLAIGLALRAAQNPFAKN